MSILVSKMQLYKENGRVFRAKTFDEYKRKLPLDLSIPSMIDYNKAPYNQQGSHYLFPNDAILSGFEVKQGILYATLKQPNKDKRVIVPPTGYWIIIFDPETGFPIKVSREKVPVDFESSGLNHRDLENGNEYALWSSSIPDIRLEHFRKSSRLITRGMRQSPNGNDNGGILSASAICPPTFLVKNIALLTISNNKGSQGFSLESRVR